MDSLNHRIRLQALCNEIHQHIANEPAFYHFPYDQGDVRISVRKGDGAKAEADFMREVQRYLDATRFPGGNPGDPEAKAELVKALEDFVERIRQ